MPRRKAPTTKTTVAKKKQPKEFDVLAMKKLVKHTYLNGIIDDAVITIKDNVATIDAIDMSQCVFVHAVENIGNAEDCQIGMQQLGVFLKVLDAIEQDTVKYTISGKDRQWLKLGIKNRGDARFLLTDPTLIATAIDGQQFIDNVSTWPSVQMPINVKPTQDFLYFMQLFGSETVIVTAKNKAVTITPAPDSPQSFDTKFGKLESDIAIDATLTGKHIQQIMDSLEFEQPDVNETPIAHFAEKEEAPLVITQGENRFWAMTTD